MSASRGIDRRAFMKAASSAVVGCAAFPTLVSPATLGKGGQTAPSDRISVGCIGVGGRGTSLMETLLKIDGVRVLAVCDVKRSQREEAKQTVLQHPGHSTCAAVTDFRRVLDRKDIDTVAIAPQDHWHAVMAVAAARAGKDIYCEKPLGVSVAESQAIRDAVKKHDRVFQTGTQQRSDSKFRFACELARNGYLGKIHTVKVASKGPHYRPSYKGPYDPMPVPEGLDFDMYLGPAPKKPYNPGRLAWPDWYLIWDYCAGFIVNWGVHHLDIALWGCPWIGAEGFELSGTATYRDEGLTDNVDSWDAEFRYAGGRRMTFTDSMGTNKAGCRFEGDKGWVHVARAGISAEPASLLQVKLKSSDLQLPRSSNHPKDFIDAVRCGKTPVADIDAGHKATILGLLADISARLKRTLKWDPRDERFVGDAEANRMLTRPHRSPWTL